VAEADASAVFSARLATQRLSGPPAGSPAQVVRELLCVQAQDAPLARAMIALRCESRAEAVAAAVARGEIVRTHVLRPTWHYVAAEDLRWLLALTSPRVESGMAARHRQLGLVGDRLDAALRIVVERLTGRAFADRGELGAVLDAAGVLAADDPLFGQQVGHVLLVAELRALLCSAPVPATRHLYALTDEVIAPEPPIEPDEATTRLVTRFVAGHGPVALADLVRWARVTLAGARTALRGYGDRFERIAVDGEELWHCPAAALPQTRPQRAWLLSVFDEAYLSYRRLPWLTPSGQPGLAKAGRFAQAGGGAVLLDQRDVGDWRRRQGRGGAQIDLALSRDLTGIERSAVDDAVDRLLAVLD
jgi:hypothetical protein